MTHTGVLLQLSKSACAILGPICLCALSVRFLRVRRLLPAAAARALLCQGLVMGWLSSRGQRAPPDMQASRRARPPSLTSVDAAALYLRVANDIGEQRPTFLHST